MKCTSKQQAERIAEAGATKMGAQGYTFRPFAMSRGAGHVVKAGGTRYAVNTHTGTCGCPFYGENAEYRTCKHLLFARQEIAEGERADREAEEMEAARYDLAGAKW